MLDDAGNHLYPYEIKVMPNGLRVGIVGIVTDYVNVWEKKENLVGVQVVDPFIEAQKALSEALRERPTLIYAYITAVLRLTLTQAEDLPSLLRMLGIRYVRSLNLTYCSQVISTCRSTDDL